MANVAKSKMITFRAPPELLGKLRDLAVEERRNLSDQLRIELEKAVENTRRSEPEALAKFRGTIGGAAVDIIRAATFALEQRIEKLEAASGRSGAR